MMEFKTFLDEIAQDILVKHADPGQVQLVFPNRRAGLFFQQRLATKLTKAVWSPIIGTMEEFVYSFSTLKPADPLSLILELYHAFIHEQGKVAAVPEELMDGFEKFYFWGEMLLRDFQDIDQALVMPHQIFQGVKSQKELDELFYFLDEDDQNAIKMFWQGFFPESGEGQGQFLKTWGILHPVYSHFTQNLKAKGMGYQGLIYREVAESCMKSTIATPEKHIIFAGFNALTPAEEEIIKHFVHDHGAEVYWDYDDYYVGENSSTQEAGNYLRRYKADPILGKTFGDLPRNHMTEAKTFETVGVSLEVGQAKAACAYLGEQIENGVFAVDKTVLVLPQEHMLFPILNSLPEGLSQLNVTMGYPLKETPLYSLVECMIQLPELVKVSKENTQSIHYKGVMSILSHPYIFPLFPTEIKVLLKEIRSKNMVYVPLDILHGTGLPLIDKVFTILNDGKLQLAHINEIIEQLHGGLANTAGLEQEYFYHFHQVLARLKEILSMQTLPISSGTLLRLFRQIARSMKIPFSGEPLQGLQVMGVLETRNLDFENVIVVSMNEDSFPATAKTGSFIPYNIRKAFGLPTFEQQDSIYAYLFYRLIQRAKHVRFYYNTHADFGLSGEVSRYIHQLKFESGHAVADYFLLQNFSIGKPHPIAIEKSGGVLQSLYRFMEGGTDSLSPTPLSVYMQCSLKFYFQYIARLRESDEVAEQLDPAMFGTILHDAIEVLYENITSSKKTMVIDTVDFFAIRSGVDGAIEQAFRKFYHTQVGQKFLMEGRNVIMASLVKDYIHRVLKLDEAYAPFKILALEGKGQGYKTTHQVGIAGKYWQVSIKGTIDRIDRKQDTVRILDYKTGKDKRLVKDIPSLFNTKDTLHNKAAFQLFIYAMLYQQKYGTGSTISPGIFNITELYQEGFIPSLHWVKGGTIGDMRTYLPEFKEHLTTLLTEIFDPAIPFSQTEELNRCSYCQYKGICHR